jgi:hypothetical protein
MTNLRSGRDFRKTLNSLVGVVLSLILCLGNPSTLHAQVDPATAIAIASAVLDLLEQSMASDKDAQTSQQLAAIESQLQDINNKLSGLQNQLSLLSSALSALSVHIDQDFDAEARIKVASEIQTVADHWDGWSQKADPSWQTDADRALYDLQVDTQNLFVRQSFGSFATVGLSLNVQKDLMILLGTDSTTTANIYRDFGKYFAQASDPSVSGSLATALSNQQTTAAALLPRFTGAQQFICPVSPVTSSCCGPLHVCSYQTYQAVSGSVAQAFTLVGPTSTWTLSNIEDDNACRPPSLQPGRMPVSLRLPSENLPMFVDPQVFKCPAELESLRQGYLTAAGNVTLLTGAIEVTKKFQAAALALVAASTPAAAPQPTTKTAMLELESITVKHDGAPGSTQWRFEVYLNGTKVGTIPEYKFVANKKTVSANTPDGVQWSAVPIPNAAKLDIQVLGFRSNSTVPATGGIVEKWGVTKPESDLKIEINSSVALLGAFVFNFSIK